MPFSRMHWSPTARLVPAGGTDPLTQGFLLELRIALPRALAHIKRNAAEGATEQPITIGELIWRFIAEQEDRYGLGMHGALSGTFGGDGDWAREALCFGFLKSGGGRRGQRGCTDRARLVLSRTPSEYCLVTTASGEVGAAVTAGGVPLAGTGR